jgi:hypothetical protein
MIWLGSSNVLAAATFSVEPAPWWIVAGVAGLGIVGGVAGVRVWQGKPINPHNTLEAEDRLAFLSVTLLPGSIMFLCWTVIALVSELGPLNTSRGSSVALILVQVAFGFMSLVAAGIGISLFFFCKPNRFVPPRLRKL